MKHARFTILAALSAAALCMALVPACNDGGEGDFRIEPAAITLGKSDQAVVLRIVGGQYPFTWRVADTSLGTISGEGRQATQVAATNGAGTVTNGNTAVQANQAEIAGAGHSITYTRTDKNGVNTVTIEDSQSWTASATITQQDDPPETEALTISPTSASLANDGDKTAFTGSGGVGPYQWSVGDDGRGSVNSDAYTQATYTRRSAGDNTVIVTDRKGHVAIATVTQPAVSMTVSANPGSLAAFGDQSIVTVSGGVPPYDWSVLDGSRGHLIGATDGASVTYVRDAAGDNTIQIRDSNNVVAHVIINQP